MVSFVAIPYFHLHYFPELGFAVARLIANFQKLCANVGRNVDPAPPERALHLYAPASVENCSIWNYPHIPKLSPDCQSLRFNLSPPPCLCLLPGETVPFATTPGRERQASAFARSRRGTARRATY